MRPLLPRLSPAVRALALVLLATVLATYVWWPMIDLAPYTADGDGRYFQHQWEAGKAAIRYYREFPLWNPFDCKGVPMWDHPESLTGSPILLLATPLSATKTLWVWSITHCVLGFLSMWLLARRELVLRPTSAFVAASLWAFAVSHISQYSGAHASLVDFWLAPLLVYLWRRAEHDYSAAVKLGLVVAFMVYEGATYPLPFTIVLVALETLTRVTPLRRLPRIIAAGAVTGVVAIGASAARLLPLLDELSSKKRGNMLPDVDTLARVNTLFHMYLWREPRWWHHLPKQQYVWGEYIAYIGVVVLVLALIGFGISLREHRWLCALAALTTLLMLGHFARWAPWHLLNRHVHPYTSMRVPSRFRLLMQMSIALWAALAVERLPRIAQRLTKGKHRVEQAAHALVFTVAVLGVADGMNLGRDITWRMHHGAPEFPIARSPTFYYSNDEVGEWLDQPRQNRSWVGCRSYEWPANYGAPVWVGNVPQARPKPTEVQVLTVANVVRTQNTFSFDVDAQEPGRVLVNSAHHRGWRSSVGTVVDDRTLLAVDVPAGKHHVQMRYWPRLLTPGLWISAASALGVLAFYGFRLFFRRRALRRMLGTK